MTTLYKSVSDPEIVNEREFAFRTIPQLWRVSESQVCVNHRFRGSADFKPDLVRPSFLFNVFGHIGKGSRYGCDAVCNENANILVSLHPCKVSVRSPNKSDRCYHIRGSRKDPRGTTASAGRVVVVVRRLLDRSMPRLFHRLGERDTTVGSLGQISRSQSVRRIVGGLHPNSLDPPPFGGFEERITAFFGALLCALAGVKKEWPMTARIRLRRRLRPRSFRWRCVQRVLHGPPSPRRSQSFWDQAAEPACRPRPRLRLPAGSHRNGHGRCH